MVDSAAHVRRRGWLKELRPCRTAAVAYGGASLGHRRHTMNSRHLQLWQTPHRLMAFQAKIVAGLAIADLVIAATGLMLYDGLPRMVHVGALALVGMTNLSWATGSLLPEEQGGKALRD